MISRRFMSLLAAFGCLALYTVYEQSRSIHIGYDINRLIRDQDELKDMSRKLEFTLNQKRSPAVLPGKVAQFGIKLEMGTGNRFVTKLIPPAQPAPEWVVEGGHRGR